MDKRKRELIEEAAEMIRHEYSISCPVGDIKELVKMMGGEIHLVDEPLLIEGRVYKEKTGEGCNFVIEVSKRATDRWLRCHVAEALGHLFIHMGYIYDPEKWDKQKTYEFYSNKDIEERCVADEFAEALLMPKRDMLRYVDNVDGSEVNIFDAGEYFGVPAGSVLARCKTLRLIEDI